MDRITSSRPFWNRPDQISILALVLLSIAGIILILYITDIGPWAYSDSAAYLTTAKNIAAGRGVVLQDSNGVFSLLPLHAPLYPLVVSLPTAFGADVLQASRWINAFLFGLTIFLTGWISWHVSRSFWITLSTAGLILFGLEPVQAFSGAMSEGLFISFGLLSLVLIALAVEKPNHQVLLLIGAGLAAGLSTLARYTGLAVLVAGGTSVFILTNKRFIQRLKNATIFAIPGMILSALWLIPVYRATQTFASRPVGAMAGLSEKIDLYFKTFMEVIGGWLPFFNRGNHIFPPTQKIILAWLALAGLVFFVWKKRLRIGPGKFSSRNPVNLLWIVGLFCITYVLLHLGAFVTADTQPDINGRLLLPIYFGGILLAASFAAYIRLVLTRKRIASLTFAGLAILTLWYHHGQVQNYVFEMHNYGYGYASKRWQGNPLFEEIKSLDPSVPLYSNNSALVLFYTERFPKSLQPDVEAEIYPLQDAQDAALIFFNDIGESDLPGSYDQYVQDLEQQYSVAFENDQGTVLIPKIP